MARELSKVLTGRGQEETGQEIPSSSIASLPAAGRVGSGRGVGSLLSPTILSHTLLAVGATLNGWEGGTRQKPPNHSQPARRP